MKTSINKNKHLLVLGFIVSISFFFRFYNLSNLFNFSLDEEVIAFHVRRISTAEHFPLLGVNAAGTGLYLGPLYFYAAAPFFVLLNNQALAGAVFASTLGVATTVALYWMGLTLFSRRVGLIMSLLHATSLPLALFERKFFNPTPMTLVIALIFLAIHKLSQKDLKSTKSFRLKYAVVLGALLGLLFHINLSLLWLLPFVFVWLIFKSIVSKKELVAILLSISVLLLPLLLFELRHEWLQVRALRSLLEGNKFLENPEAPYYWGFPFTIPAKLLLMNLSSKNISAELETCAQAIKNSFHWFGLAVALVSSVFAMKGLKDRSIQLFACAALFGLVSLLVFPSRVQEYYAFSLVVPALGLVAFGLSEWGKNIHSSVTYVILTILVAANFWQFRNLKHPYSLEAKSKAVQEIIFKTQSRNYSFHEAGDSCSGFGLVYLLQNANHAPTSSFADPIIAWLYDEKNIPIEQEDIDVTARFESNKITIETNAVKSKNF